MAKKTPPVETPTAPAADSIESPVPAAPERAPVQMLAFVKDTGIPGGEFVTAGTTIEQLGTRPWLTPAWIKDATDYGHLALSTR